MSSRHTGTSMAGMQAAGLSGQTSRGVVTDAYLSIGLWHGNLRGRCLQLHAMRAVVGAAAQEAAWLEPSRECMADIVQSQIRHLGNLRSTPGLVTP